MVGFGQWVADHFNRLLFKLMRSTYLYNMSWEDPRIDCRVLNLKKSDRVITIASAGDNVFDYLIEGAGEVCAVDANACQIALAELKAEAAKEMSYEEFFLAFGTSDMALLREYYRRTLREKLTEPSRQFWDINIDTTSNLVYSGTSGKPTDNTLIKKNNENKMKIE